MRDFPAGDPFVSLIAPELRATGASSAAPTNGGASTGTSGGSDALGVTPPASLAFDALTDLFLGGSARTALAGAEPPAPHRAATAPRTAAAIPAPGPDSVSTEILVAGHLPVMASAWIQQYARDRASATGAPVALVDLRTARAWMQVIDPDARFIPEAAATFPAALRAARPTVRTWMVRVDESDESAMRAAAPSATITLLSGADQAATVGAYRAIKRLAAGARPDSVSIAVMGADAHDAAHAVDRVGAAAKSFLGVDVTRTTLSPKVDASLRPVTAFAGPLPAGGSGAAIKLLAETLAPAIPAAPEDDESDDVVTTAPAPVTLPPPAPTKPARSAAEPLPARTAPAAQVLSDPSPEAPLHVLVAGLEPIPVRCPVAPGIKLASDSQGRLHLISIDAANSAEPVAPHVERLLAAGAWATENHELLRVAFPRLGGSDRTGDRPPTPPVLHLAVDQPRRVRHLLDTPVKLHVLASPSPGARGWVARALN